MPTLPAVFVELKATTDDFRAKLADAQKSVKNFSDQSTSGLQKMQQVGGIAFAAVSAAAVTFGTIAVKAALDGQQAHAQLVNAVQNSGTAFASVSGQVDGMADKFAKLGYENDQVEAALTRLVTATGNTNTAMQNMGLAADLARARNISLTDAATALGKILDGNMRGMQAFGLSTKDASGGTLTVAEAVKELNDRFGGSAQANAGTYMGKLQAMNAEWHNMVEAVGNELLPTLANLAGDMAGVIGWFQQHTQVAQTLAFVIGGPLVIAMSSYVAKQAVAFGTGVINSVKSIAAAIGGLLVPATEAEEAAMTGAAVAESILTAGLTVAAGAAAAYIIHQAGSKSATDATTSSVGDLTGGLGGLGGAETDVGVATDATNNQLQAQSNLLKQLAGDTAGQTSEILKLIGDQNSLDSATQKLKDSTGANSEVSKQAAQHAKDLASANKDLKQANDDVTTAIDKAAAAQKKLNDLLAPQTQRNITDAADAHSAANDRLTRANLDVKDKTTALTVAIGQYGEGSKEATLAQLDLNDSLREVDSAQDAVTDTTQSLADAQRQTIGSTDDITQANKDLSAANDAVTEAQTKQKDAQANLNTVLANKGAIDAAKTDAQNLAQNTLAWQQATAQLNTDWGTLNDLLAAHPELRAQLIGDLNSLKAALPKGSDVTGLNSLLDKLNAPSLPDSVMAKIPDLLKALTPDLGNITGGYGGGGGAKPPAGGGANGVAIILGGMPNMSGISGTGGSLTLLPGLQSGGPARAGQSYIVGEHGPELFVPSTSGTVVPGAASGSPLGNVTVNVNVSGGFYGDTQSLALAVRDELLKFSRNNVAVGLS